MFAQRPTPLSPATVATALVIAHMALWWIAPTLLLGNLHTDSAEMAYWGFDPQWTYPKHPPLASIIAATAIRLFGHAYGTLVGLGQVCVGLSALYVWATLARRAGDRAALVGVVLLIASPSATIFAFQVNHNTLMMPFVAALLFHVLRYVETSRWVDAAIIGVIVGLGTLEKYALLVFPLAIVAVAVLRPGLRARLLAWPVLAAMIIAVAILAPHGLALVDVSAGSLDRATTGRALRGFADALRSLGDFATAALLVLLIPVVFLICRRGRQIAALMKPQDDGDWIVAAALFGSFVIMLAAAMATGQAIKPLWSIGFMPAAAIWGGLLAGRDFPHTPSPTADVRLGQLGFGVSAMLLAGFLAYLGVGVAIGKPRWDWMADAAALSREVATVWPAERGPLPAVLIDARGITGLAGLLHKDLPRTVEIGEGRISAWTDKAWLARAGGVAIFSAGTDPAIPVAGLCPVVLRAYELPSVWGATTVPLRLAVMASRPGVERCILPPPF